MPFAYKMLNPGRIAPVQGSFVYPEIGKWTKKIEAKELLMCFTGYHVARTPAEILAHRATDVYLCEYDGETVEGTDKLLVQRVRLIKQVMGQREWVLFAADCAEHVLANFESVFPDDDRPRKALDAARAFALDPSDKNRDAAWSAGSAAWSAAESAGSAESAAWSAAWSAGSAAAWSTGSAAAWSAATWSAESAAAAAAWSARSAAWSARSAAAAAAWSARSAEREWGYARLQQYLDGTATSNERSHK